KTPSVTSVAAAGDAITYTITVVNDGDVTLSSVAVADPLCAPVLTSGDTDGDGSLDVGETWTYSCTYAVTQLDINAGSIANTATVDAADPHGGPVSAVDSATVVVNAAPHLTVTKTPSVTTVDRKSVVEG